MGVGVRSGLHDYLDGITEEGGPAPGTDSGFAIAKVVWWGYSWSFPLHQVARLVDYEYLNPDRPSGLTKRGKQQTEPSQEIAQRVKRIER